MMAFSDNEREKLLRYVEAKEFNRGSLSPLERNELENWLERSEEARLEVEAIADHLRLLQSLPQPEMPADLASRCLERMERGGTAWSAGPYLKWAASTVIVLVIFSAGMWSGGVFFSHEEPTFVSLLDQQGGLITRLETQLAERYQETALTSTNPWYVPVTRLKNSTEILAAYYQENEKDPVIERGLAAALAQNVQLLEALCNYVESDRDIPELDILAFSTPDQTIENAI